MSPPPRAPRMPQPRPARPRFSVSAARPPTRPRRPRALVRSMEHARSQRRPRPRRFRRRQRDCGGGRAGRSNERSRRGQRLAWPLGLAGDVIGSRMRAALPNSLLTISLWLQRARSQIGGAPVACASEWTPFGIDEWFFCGSPPFARAIRKRNIRTFAHWQGDRIRICSFVVSTPEFCYVISSNLGINFHENNRFTHA